MRIYTDGACVPNPGTGGWGFVAIDGNGVLYEATGTENDATSNRMEMIAVIKALEWLPPGNVTRTSWQKEQ